MTPPAPSSALRLLPVLSGAAVLLLALVVLAGYATASVALVQVRADLTPVQGATALGLVAAGVGLIGLARGRRIVAGGAGALLLLVPALVLAQYLLGFDLGVDRPTWPAPYPHWTPHPGRMAPNTAAALLLCGASIVAFPRHPFLGSLLASFVLAIGTVAMLGYAVGLRQAFAWGPFTPMALLGAGGFVLAGSGLLALGYQRDARRLEPRRWLASVTSAAVVAALALVFWQMLHVRDPGLLEPLPELALVLFLLVALLLGVAMRTSDVAALRARRFESAVEARTRELDRLARDLSLEIAEGRRSEATLRRTQEVARLLSSELDRERILEAVTQAGRELTGASRAAFVDTAPAPGAEEGRRVAVPVPSRRSGETRGWLVFEDGESVFGERDEGIASTLAAQLAVTLDNSELYEAERLAGREAQRASAAKDRFLAVLAHELRNPLAAVHNALEVLRRTPDASLEEDLRPLLERQVAWLRRLVDDLLDQARIAAGKPDLRLEPVELSALVAEVLKAFEPQLEAAGLKLETRLPAERLWVRGDPGRLGQVLQNLLSNALKFTDAGGRVRVEVAAEGAQAVVRVRDTGVGIDSEDLGRVLDAFVQSERRRDRERRPGLGLGLSIAKGFLEAHGGRLEVSSGGAGSGAEFAFRLDRARPDGRAVEAADPGSAASPRRILVIDDHADSAETLRLLLESEGHHVETAPDGAAGLEAVGRLRPQVVLCDLDLPGMDGFEVARALRRGGPPRPRRVFALTGFLDPASLERARSAGFDGHLAKPLDLRKLYRLLADDEGAPSWGAGR